MKARHQNGILTCRNILLPGILTLGLLITGCGGSSSSGNSRPALANINENIAPLFVGMVLFSHEMSDDLMQMAYWPAEDMLDQGLCPENILEDDGEGNIHIAFRDCEVFENEDESQRFFGSFTRRPHDEADSYTLTIDDFEILREQRQGQNYQTQRTFLSGWLERSYDHASDPTAGTVTARNLEQLMEVSMETGSMSVRAYMHLIAHDLTTPFTLNSDGSVQQTSPSGEISVFMGTERAGGRAIITTPSELTFEGWDCLAYGEIHFEGANNTWMSIVAMGQDDIVVTINGDALPSMGCIDLQDWTYSSIPF